MDSMPVRQLCFGGGHEVKWLITEHNYSLIAIFVHTSVPQSVWNKTLEIPFFFLAFSRPFKYSFLYMLLSYYTYIVAKIGA